MTTQTAAPKKAATKYLILEQIQMKDQFYEGPVWIGRGHVLARGPKSAKALAGRKIQETGDVNTGDTLTLVVVPERSWDPETFEAEYELKLRSKA